MNSYFHNNFYIKEKEKKRSIFSLKKTWLILIIGLALGFFVWKLFFQEEKIEKIEVNIPEAVEEIDEKEQTAEFENSEPVEYFYKPIPISMDVIKNKGCVADGLLSGYGKDTKNAVKMVNRSECRYLHRALETWGAAPDFKKAKKIMEKIGRDDLIYGMFIAENIKKNEEYEYEDEDRDFNFRKMCSPGTDNVWGEHTCKPSLKKEEYRKYVLYMTKQAMDAGIQSFLFGQVYYQDVADIEKTELLDVMVEMRTYAASKNMDIVIGAQTGNIQDEEYLRMFDFVEGGVGIGEDGKIEDGPCWSRLSSCWALLWHEKYSTKAHNVLLHLDWSGVSFDDSSVFARMNREKRKETLEELYSYFTSRNMGFLLPLMATLDKNNGGCYGPSKGFYSAYDGYRCKDEKTINDILRGKK